MTSAVRRYLLVALLAGVAARGAEALPEGPQGSSTGDPGAASQMLSPAVDGQQFTGAATTSIAFEVPPGRNGMQPNLALAYSSQGGPGPYGTGWDLPIGRIERTLRKGVPKYDSSDVFVLNLPDGATELVPLPDGSFAARIDDGRARITSNVGANTWTLHDRSGREFVFGGTAAARTGRTPTTFGGTFAWSLTQVRDANGNTVTFTYVTGTGFAWPSTITYGANAAAGVSDTYTVTFSYGTRTGTAVRVSYAGGFHMTYDRNLTAVAVTRGATAIRSWALTWRSSGSNGLPLLERVVLRGADGQAMKLANGNDAATVYGYHEKSSLAYQPPLFQQLGASFNYFRDETLETSENADPQLRCTMRDFLDMNGDGRPDLVRTGGWTSGNPYWRVNLNNGLEAAQLFDPVDVSWRAPVGCLSHRVVDPQGTTAIATTDKAVLDMNGDARPDFVSIAQNGGQYELRVFLNTGSGFATSHQVWATGIPALREGEAVSGAVYRDLIDLNADGRPEVVRTDPDATWHVRWNTGTALSAAVTFTGPTANIRNGGPDSGDGNIRSDLFDVNGDALPDKVVAGTDAQGDFWRVWLGTGTGFTGTFERWSTPRPLIRAWNEDEQLFDYDVFDVTGDGLPDCVDARPGEWRVFRNSGRGFLPMQSWPSPGAIRARHDDENANALRVDSFDLDGDGYVDHIQLPGGSATTATIELANAGLGRTDTLASINVNEGQAITHLEYTPSVRWSTPNVEPSLTILGAPAWVGYLPFPVWAVSKITGTASFGPSVSQRFRYDGGYFDGVRREFRGFQYAWRTDDYGSTVTTRFSQAEPLQGRAAQQWLFARDPAVSAQPGLRQETRFDWQYQILNARYLPTLGSRRVTEYASAADVPWSNTGSATVTSTFSYDTCGNLTREVVTDSLASGETLSDNSTTFHQLSGGCNTYRVCGGVCDRVQTTSQVGGVTKAYSYDARGNVIEVEATGPDTPTTAMTYDLAGNLATITNPRGAVTKYTYDSRLLRVVAKVEDDDGADLKTTYTYDTALWRLTSVSGPRREPDTAAACSATAYTYDAFGRLVSVIEPGQTIQVPTRSYRYALGSPSLIETSTLELEPSPHYVPSVTFYDGAGRPIQTQTSRILTGANPVTVIGDAVERTTGGRVTRQFVPWVATTAATVFAAVPGTHAATTFTYDEFGRVIATDPPDHRTVTTSRAKLRVVRACDPKHTLSASQGSCRESQVDGLGRVVAERTYLGNATTAYATRTLAYDGAGRVVHETQNGNAATTIVTTYDALGRKTQVTDPDSGTWRYGYDAGGNLTSLDDPVVGQRVEYEYDALNRLLRKRAFGLDALGQETVTDTTYSYDSALCGLGRIARVDDASGSTTVAAYTSRGNVLQSTKTIAFDGDARFFVSSSTFDDLGRAKTTLYPYPDANKVETVFFDYNWSGRLSRIRSDHGGYLLGAKFDEFGHVVDLSYGNGVHDQATYWDRSAGFRLKELITRKPAQAPLRDVLYRDYDPNGQVLAIHDQLHNAASPLSLTQLATYDDASRLVGSVQCGGGRYQGTFSHDAYGNLSSKEGAGYTYNADGPHQPSTVGGIDVEYDDNGNVVGLPGDRTLVYDAEGRLVRVDRDGTTIARYLYDYSGRRVAAQTPQGTRLFFDAFDWHDDEIVRYFRVGDRLIASSPVADTGLLVAVPPSRRSIMLAQMVGGVPALGLLAIGLALAGRRRRGSGLHRRWVRRPAAVLVIAFYLAQLPSLPAAVACPQDPTTATPPAGTIFYHADHLGSPQLLTNHQGAVLEHLVHRPYGMLGAVYDGAGTVVDESQSPFSFTGHRADDGTGLTYMGARYYDLALGMFVSHDPARQFASPYSYGAGNPLNGRDPTGAIFGIDDAIFWGIVIGFAVLGGVAAGVQASLNGASVGQAVLAGVLGAVQSGVMAAVGIVGGPGLAAASPTLSTAFSLVSVGYAVYSGYQAIDSGQYATGALALLTAAIAIAGAAYGALGSSSAELATGNTEQTGIQLAGNTEGPVLNDAGPQYAVQDHEIYIGAKFTETDAQAGKVGIGHSFVGLREPGGEIQTYGFYPRAGANFDGIKALRTVPGSLREGVDQGYLQSALAGEKGYSVVKYSVTRSQYLKALDVVTAYQSNSYSAVFRNCTHFALDLAGAAGVRVPSAGLISRPAVFQPALRHFGERLP